MIDRDFFASGRESLNRDHLSETPRKWTIGQSFSSGIPTNSPQRIITFTNTPQWPILAIGGYDAPEGLWDISQNQGYEWSPAAIAGSTGTGAGSSTFWIGRRTSPTPGKAYTMQGGAGSGTGFEECCLIEMPGLIGEVLWQGQTSGTSTTLTTPTPKQGYWVPGCIFLVTGRWRSGGASSFSITLTTKQEGSHVLVMMGNITIAWLYRYIPGSRPAATVVYARSVLAGLQAAIIR
jgi:hypothetical protein